MSRRICDKSCFLLASVAEYTVFACPPVTHAGLMGDGQAAFRVISESSLLAQFEIQ